MSPLGLDPARPFPRIQNKSLNFIVRLEGKDAFDRDSELAIVQAPRSLPRVVPLPGVGAGGCVLLSAIVQAFVPKLFSGIRVIGCYQFRITRNSDLFVDEEEIDDLGARSRASSPTAATAPRCAWRPPTTARRTWSGSCRDSSPPPRSTCTRSQAR